MVKKWIPTLIVLLLGLGYLVSSVVQPVSANRLFQDDPEKPQIGMVIDVSNSMASFLLPDELQGDLRLLQDFIDEIENMDLFIDLSEKIKSVEENPEFIAAQEASAEADFNFHNWFKENGYNNIGIIHQNIQEQLIAINCAGDLNEDIARANSMEEVEALVNEDCSAPIVFDEEMASVKVLVDYIENPDYIALKSAFEDTELVFDQVKEELDYTETQLAYQTLLITHGYNDFKREFGLIAEQQGFSTRLKHAKLAAQTIIDLVGLDNKARNRESLISLESFSTTPTHLHSLTADYAQLELLISQMEPLAFTNIGGGLTIALDEIEGNGDIEQPSTIILLSDGHTNRGMTAEEILEVIPDRAEELQTRICAVGFGNDESEVDARLLRGLAEETDGAYLFAKTGEELIGFFVACQQALIADSIQQFNGLALANEIQEAGFAQVGENTAAMNITLTSLDSGLELVLTDPSGVEVGDDYEGFLGQGTGSVKLFSITNPKPGEWRIQVKSKNLGAISSAYSIAVSIELMEFPTGGPTAIPTPEAVSQSTQLKTSLLIAGVVVGVLGVVALLILLMLRLFGGLKKTAVIVTLVIILILAAGVFAFSMFNPQLIRPVAMLVEPSHTPTMTKVPTSTKNPTYEPSKTSTMMAPTATPMPEALNIENITALRPMRLPLENTYFDIAVSSSGNILAGAVWDGWSGTLDELRYQIQFSQVLSSGAVLPKINVLGHTAYIRAIALPAASNQMAASGADDDTVKLWDVQNGLLIHTFEETSDVYSVALSPDGALLAAGMVQPVVKIWNTQDFSEIRTLNAGVGPITALGYSPDGLQLASASAVVGDFTIRLWNTETWQEARRLNAHGDIVSDLVFSPDSTLLASCSYDGTARIYDAVGGRLLFELAGHENNVSAVAFSPFGDLIVTGSNKKIRVWRVADGSLLFEYEVGEIISSLDFSSTGDLLLVGQYGQMDILGIQP
ncbi:MAG: VWA domain-containing protein [Anaerolineaceae bacterium]|nr:VWA domain-containing protein [Anaerolineaceae bacterium]